MRVALGEFGDGSGSRLQWEKWGLGAGLGS